MESNRGAKGSSKAAKPAAKGQKPKQPQKTSQPKSGPNSSSSDTFPSGRPGDVARSPTRSPARSPARSPTRKKEGFDNSVPRGDLPRCVAESLAESSNLQAIEPKLKSEDKPKDPKSRTSKSKGTKLDDPKKDSKADSKVDSSEDIKIDGLKLEPPKAEPPKEVPNSEDSTQLSSSTNEAPGEPLGLEEPPKALGLDGYQVLYVGDIDHISREEHLWHVFAPWAEGIRSIRLIRYVGKPFSLTHAYVNFTNHADAQHALENVQPLFVNSSYCRVVPYDGETLKRPDRFDQNGGSGVFIKNLDVQVTASMLWGYFMAFGTILGCRVAIDDFGGPRGFAYVTFEQPEQATAAIARMDGQLIGRRRVLVSRNLPKDQRGVRVFIKFDSDAPKNALRDADVRDALQRFGSLEAVSVPKDPAGLARGFALATFREHADAARALAEVKEISGVSVFMDLATGSNPHNRASPATERSPSFGSLTPTLQPTSAPVVLSTSNPLPNAMAQPHTAQRFVTNSLSNQKVSSTNLFVRPLPSDIREDDLHAEFGKFGAISSAKVILHPEGYSRGFGFVSFEIPSDARKAAEELNGAERWGQQLFVAPAQSKRKPPPRLNLHQASLARSMASPMPPFAGLYYIPMEYAYDYSPYAAAAALSMAAPASMMPAPLPTQGSLAHLENASIEELGEWLHPYVLQHGSIGGNPELASRITGLLLQQPKPDIVSWLENPLLMDRRIQQGFDAYQEWLASQNGG